MRSWSVTKKCFYIVQMNMINAMPMNPRHGKCVDRVNIMTWFTSSWDDNITLVLIYGSRGFWNKFTNNTHIEVPKITNYMIVSHFVEHFIQMIPNIECVDFTSMLALVHINPLDRIHMHVQWVYVASECSGCLNYLEKI